MGRLFPVALICALYFLPAVSHEALGKRPEEVEVVLEPELQAKNFIEFYERLERTGQAALVTADSALWAVRTLHEQALPALEVHALAPRLEEILDVLNAALEPVETAPPVVLVGQIKEPLPPKLVGPARRARRTVQVARFLLSGRGDPPPEIRDEIERIGRHEGIEISDVLRQKIDYSRLVPKGHYTRTDGLRRYFLVATWLEGIVFRMDERDVENGEYPLGRPGVKTGWFGEVETFEAEELDRGAIKKKEMAKLEKIYPLQGLEEMRAAALLSILMENAMTPNGKTALETWREMDDALTGWRGPSREFGPSALLESLRPRVEKPKAPWNAYDALWFLNDDYDVMSWLAWLESRVRPKDDPVNLGRRGFALVGLRPGVDYRILRSHAASDSWEAVHSGEGTPFTLVKDPKGGGVRGLFRGCDLLTAMGNHLARRQLIQGGDTHYMAYRTQAERAKVVWEISLQKKSHASVYQKLLKTVEIAAEPEVARPPADYVAQEEHRLVRLNAALVHWASLQRDMVPNARHNYSGPDPQRPAPLEERPFAGPRGYVDPFPDLYELLAETAGEIGRVLEDAERLPAPYVANCEAVEELMERLEDIARKEIKKPKKIDDEDYLLIRQWGGRLKRALFLPRKRTIPTGFDFEEPLPLVVDVHTYGSHCLQPAVGRLDEVRTVVPVAGRDTPVTGAILPYYEFKSPRSDRMTDQSWREALQKGFPLEPLILRHCPSVQKASP